MCVLKISGVYPTISFISLWEADYRGLLYPMLCLNVWIISSNEYIAFEVIAFVIRKEKQTYNRKGLMSLYLLGKDFFFPHLT